MRKTTILYERILENNLIEREFFIRTVRAHHNRWLHDRHRIVFHEIHDVDISDAIVRVIWFDDVLAKESIECQHNSIVENE